MVPPLLVHGPSPDLGLQVTHGVLKLLTSVARRHPVFALRQAKEGMDNDAIIREVRGALGLSKTLRCGGQ